MAEPYRRARLLAYFIVVGARTLPLHPIFTLSQRGAHVRDLVDLAIEFRTWLGNGLL
jgi:hypothetical protein